jgi:large subunit ribosomal protein L54
MLDKKQTNADLKANDFMKWRRRQLRKENTKKINNNNFLSKM